MCFAICGGSALAATRTIAPARQRTASVEFKLKNLAPADIKSASLLVGKRSLKLSLPVVRKAAAKGVLKVKLPKSLRATGRRPRVRLRIVLGLAPAVPPPVK